MLFVVHVVNPYINNVKTRDRDYANYKLQLLYTFRFRMLEKAFILSISKCKNK